MDGHVTVHRDRVAGDAAADVEIAAGDGVGALMRGAGGHFLVADLEAVGLWRAKAAEELAQEQDLRAQLIVHHGGR
jgi:hypothetical protein